MTWRTVDRIVVRLVAAALTLAVLLLEARVDRCERVAEAVSKLSGW